MESQRRRARGRAGAVAVAVAAALVVTGCGEADDGVAVGGVRTVSAEQAVEVAAEQSTVVLDVRTPEEFAEGHVAGARNVPLAGEFEKAVADLPRDGRYVLYCRTGNRSAEAADIMERLGFTDVLDAGGLTALADAGAEVVRG